MELASIETLAALEAPRIIALSSDSANLLHSLIASYGERLYNWQGVGSEVTSTEEDTIDELVARCDYELMSPLVGLILPTGGNVPQGTLLCDGATYLKADYPRLWDVMDISFEVDPTHFKVPDLRDRFVLGTGATFAMGASGGEVNHTLTISEMPSHTHTNAPHAHTEQGVAASLATIGEGVPAQSGLPIPSITGGTSVPIDNTGGSASHNNMPPYQTLKWVIIW